MATSMIFVTLLMLACHVALSLGDYYGAIPEPDKSALEAFKAAVVNKDKFPKLTCDGVNFWCDDSRRVYYIFLYNKRLEGSIVPEIGNLTKLRELTLSYNKFNGSIPSSIGRLKSLRYLFLYSNRLSGSIPSSIGQLTKLQYLSLPINRLSGPIPSSIGQLKSLKYLWLFSNQLSGGIPSSVSQIKSLTTFSISNNYFTGPILRVNTHPTCVELLANCLFGSNLPSNCKPIKQRSKSSCGAFCNATQPGGPCGGGGICSKVTNVTSPTCACNEGYSNQANKFTCKLLPQPPPPRLPPLSRRL